MGPMPLGHVAPEQPPVQVGDVPEFVLVAQPIPQPIYVVNQGTYPFVHGYEFYRRSYYYGGGWPGWRHAHHFGPARHYYGPVEK